MVAHACHLSTGGDCSRRTPCSRSAWVAYLKINFCKGSKKTPGFIFSLPCSRGGGCSASQHVALTRKQASRHLDVSAPRSEVVIQLPGFWHFVMTTQASEDREYARHIGKRWSQDLNCGLLLCRRVLRHCSMSVPEPGPQFKSSWLLPANLRMSHFFSHAPFRSDQPSDQSFWCMFTIHKIRFNFQRCPRLFFTRSSISLPSRPTSTP